MAIISWISPDRFFRVRQAFYAYLSAKFQEIVSCSRFAFLIFGSARATLFAFSAGRLSVFERKAFESALPAFSRLDKRTFLRANPFGTPLLPDIFQKA